MKRITNIKPYDGTVVYRLYDKDRHLIYVGSSNNYVKRIRSHLMLQEWWHEIYYYDIIFVEEVDRFELERFHINQLDPEYNVMWKREGSSPPRAVSLLATTNKPAKAIKEYNYKNKIIKKDINTIKQIEYPNGATITIKGEYHIVTIIKKDGNKSSMRFYNLIEAEKWIKYVNRTINKKN